MSVQKCYPDLTHESMCVCACLQLQHMNTCVHAFSVENRSGASNTFVGLERVFQQILARRDAHSSNMSATDCICCWKSWTVIIHTFVCHWAGF